MSFIYCLEELEDHLKFTVRGGPSSLQEMFSYVNYMIERTRIAEKNRVLVDETFATIKMDFHNAVKEFNIPNHDFMLERNIRVAVVCAPHSIDMYSYFESSLQERPYDLKVFDDMKPAYNWLGVS